MPDYIITDNEIKTYEKSTTEFLNKGAYAALKEDGSVVAWGKSDYGGDISQIKDDLKNITQIFSSSSGFAALKNDGSVISWGEGINSTRDRVQLDTQSISEKVGKNIVSISSGKYGFVAIKQDGSLVTWGDESINFERVKDKLQSQVVKVISGSNSFAALKNDGSVVSWGQLDKEFIDEASVPAGFPGDRFVHKSGTHRYDLTSYLDKDIVDIFCASRAFAALKSDGSVILWGGHISSGGDNPNTIAPNFQELKSGVKKIFTSEYAWAALKDDGSVFTWGGHTSYGGGDSSLVSNKLKQGVVHIVSTGEDGWAALKDDGSVVTWGYIFPRTYYWDPDPTKIEWKESGESSRVSKELSNGVKSIVANRRAFAALKDDGSVVTWGYKDKGGLQTMNGSGGKIDLSDKLKQDVIKIVSAGSGFYFLKNDGSLVSIGDRVTQTSQIDSGVKNIFPGEIPTLLMEDGSLYSLYEGSYSLLDNWIDSPSSSERNFVGLANPYTNDVLSFNAKDKGNIDGTLNDDVLSGTTRNDVIDGKYGTDTVKVTGKFRDYALNRSSGSIEIEDQRSGTTNDGTDTLSNIEYIQFTDQTVEESKVDVVKTYSGNFSDYKFYNKGSGVYQIKTDSGYDDITGLPLLTFTGEAETSSFKNISAIVDIKGTFDQVTGLNTDSGRMFRLYNASFKRLPDPDGLAYWIDNFSSGRNTIRIVASSFLGSAEFAERYGDNVSDSTYVNTLYKNVLGRDADTGGLNYWLGQLNSGAETRYEVLLGFAESAENKALFTDMTGFG